MSTNLASSFYKNAQSAPERLALSVNQREFSYGELAELSERIAGWLQSRPDGQPKLVGILASRSWPAYAGLLGTCWAGAAYVPLNPDWPESRLLRILEATALDALVVDDRGLKLLSPQILRQSPKHILAPECKSYLLGTPPTCLIAGFDALPLHDPRHFPTTMSADDAAYIIFTSGTTGSPKGVMVSTGNVASFLSAMQDLYPFSSEDRVSHRHEISFDFSVLDLFITWLSGASLHVIPSGQLMGPSRFIRERQLTVWFSVPSVIAFMRDLKMLTTGAFPSIRYSAFCGEPLAAASVRAWQEACKNSVIDNIYGPTEATVACLSQRCSEPFVVTKERGTIAIGTPFSGMEAAILDSSHKILPRGEKGELALTGEQVAQGYFKDPHKTAQRFPSIDGKTWYLTGDLAYQSADGRFHHLGRIDNQIKVLGNRVEMEDVEAHLREVCGVDAVCAIPWPIANGSAAGIVAFVSGASSIAATEIREKMQSRVPKYMVPTEIRFLASLPLSTAGKTDRQTLAAMLSENRA